MQNPAEAMGSYGGVLMLGRGRTDNTPQRSLVTVTSGEAKKTTQVGGSPPDFQARIGLHARYSSGTIYL
jgi:hypothetical protein